MVRLLSFAAAALLLALEADAAFQSGDRFLTNRKDKLRRSHINVLASTVEEAYFEDALVDNFAPIQQGTNATTWKQRYFINKQFYGGTGSPVFFFNGGESKLSGGWLTASSFIGKLAQRHGALLVGLEHRYYGLSTPTPDLSVDNLRFLSSQQHLADVARFHGYLTESLGLQGAKWVAFGGSYAGSLAAWEKLKYPKLFAGAVASSGPLFAKTDFYEYNEVVGRSLRYIGGDACYDRLREGVEGFRKLVEGGDATRGELERLFPACHPIQNELDLSVYESGIMYGIQGVVQYDDPATGDIKNLCAQFTNSSKSAIEQLSAYTLSQFPSGCLDSTFEGNADGLVEYLSKTELDPDSYIRQWFYQTCNEFGWYQTATSEHEPFYALKSVTEFATGLEVCKRVFNLDARASVQRTNDFYGGLDLTVENVTFVSGTIDPWSAIAVSNTTHLNGGSSSAVYIEGTSHCADMYGPRSTDIPALTAAHAEIGANVAKYIGAAP